MTWGRAVRQILYTLALVIVLKSCTPVFGQTRLAMDVTPRQTTVPGRVALRITVPADPTIKVLCTGLDGPTYQSGCREWAPGDPLDKPRTVVIRYMIQDAGPHTAFVETQDRSGRVLARVTAEVCATGGPASGIRC